MANGNERDDFHASRRPHLRDGELGGDYARDDWGQNFGGDYARDGDRRGLSGDYALDPRWGATGPADDYFGSNTSGRGSSCLEYGRGHCLKVQTASPDHAQAKDAALPIEC